MDERNGIEVSNTTYWFSESGFCIFIYSKYKEQAVQKWYEVWETGKTWLLLYIWKFRLLWNYLRRGYPENHIIFFVKQVLLLAWKN